MEKVLWVHEVKAELSSHNTCQLLSSRMDPLCLQVMFQPVAVNTSSFFHKANVQTFAKKAKNEKSKASTTTFQHEYINKR